MTRCVFAFSLMSVYYLLQLAAIDFALKLCYINQVINTRNIKLMFILTIKTMKKITILPEGLK